jgi:kynurenine 3-monooxygenase
MNKKIAIIGGGLVGSIWALLMRKRGFEVEVFEKRNDMRLSKEEVGRSINLIVTSRGVHALEKAGILDKALKLVVPVYGRMMHPKSGDLAYQPYGKDNERNLSISRSSLNRFLIEEAEKAGAKFHFEHSLDNIDFKSKMMTFANGVKANYDLLFGTDGAGSLVRKSLVQQFPETFKENTEWLPVCYKELFLPRPNSLNKDALHIWARGSHMMMALANLDGSFTMTVYLPKTSQIAGQVSFEKIKSRADVENLFKSEFADSVPMMPHYLEEFEKNPTGSLGTVRTSKWALGDSVALMGDAAHAIVPFFGQGMNSGFEDCTTLLQIMEQNKENWTTTLNEYDRIQRPNANAIADMAIENWYEMSEKVADPRFLLRKKVEATLEKLFPQIYKSRYGMVTYTLIPYSLVQQAGVLQDQILADLMTNMKAVEDLSLPKAEALLKDIYEPFLRKNGL